VDVPCISEVADDGMVSDDAMEMSSPALFAVLDGGVGGVVVPMPDSDVCVVGGNDAGEMGEYIGLRGV